MTKIEIIKGDILKSKSDIIVHQVNGLGIMGAGLAKQIKNKYYNVYRTYKKFCKKYDHPGNYLGINLMIDIDGKIVDRNDPDTSKRIISNVFGQTYIGTSKPQTDPKSLKQGLIDVAQFSRVHELSVAIPYKIGCGLGGGNWSEIEPMIQDIFKGCDATIYQL